MDSEANRKVDTENGWTIGAEEPENNDKDGALSRKAKLTGSVFEAPAWPLVVDRGTICERKSSLTVGRIKVDTAIRMEEQ